MYEIKWDIIFGRCYFITAFFHERFILSVLITLGLGFEQQQQHRV